MLQRTIITLLALLLLVGCTSYHKVTDLNSGKAYYTTKVKYKGSGSVDIKDGKTGARIVLPSSEVKKITKEAYNHGIYSDN